MALPAYWWLLALTILGQAVFFVSMAILRLQGKKVHRPGWLYGPLAVGGSAGLVYGFVQHDPVFMLGQCFFLILAVRAAKEGT